MSEESEECVCGFCLLFSMMSSMPTLDIRLSQRSACAIRYLAY